MTALSDRDTQMLCDLADAIRARCADAHVADLCEWLAEWAASMRDNGQSTLTELHADSLRRRIAQGRADAGRAL